MGGVAVHLQRFSEQFSSHDEFDISVLDFKQRSVTKSKSVPCGYGHLLQELNASDIVHVHLSTNKKLPFGILARLLRKRLVYTHHSSQRGNRFVMWAMKQLAHHVIVVNDHNLPTGRCKNYSVIPAFLAPTSHTDIPLDLESQLQNFQHVVCSNCFHSSNHPHGLHLINGKDAYGFDVLIQAFVDASPHLASTALVLVDPTGNAKAYVQGLLASLRPSNDCRIIYVDRSIDFFALLNKSHVFVRATRTDGDSLSIREALSCGVHVIASDAALRPDRVEVLPTDDVNRFTQAILAAVSKPKPEPQNPPDYGARILEVYRSVCQPDAQRALSRNQPQATSK